MKLLYTPLLLSLIFYFSVEKARAQKYIFIGVKGGISIPSLRAGESKNDWNKNYESRIGPYFGAFAEIQLTKHFSLQPELNYAAQGGKRFGIQPMTIPAEFLPAFQKAFNTDKDYLFANLNTVSRVNYIQIPLLLRYNTALAAKGKLKIFAHLGPYFGYRVAAKQIAQTDNLKVYMDGEGAVEIPPFAVKTFFGSSIDTVVNARNDLHRFNVGIQGGLGLSYDMGRGRIFTEGGVNYGFKYIQRGDEHGKNNIGGGMVLVGYAVNIKKKITSDNPPAKP